MISLLKFSRVFEQPRHSLDDIQSHSQYLSRVKEVVIHMLRVTEAGVLRCVDENGSRYLLDPQQHRVLQLLTLVYGR
jgi:hypothetical protein